MLASCYSAKLSMELQRIPTTIPRTRKWPRRRDEQEAARSGPMPMPPTQIDLRRLILLLTLAVALLMSANGFYASYRTQREQLIQQTQEANRVYAAKLGQGIEQLLDSIHLQLGYSATLLPKWMDQPERLQEETERLLRQSRIFNAIFVVRNDGLVLAGSPESLGLRNQTLRSDGAKEALQKHRFLISAPYISARNNLVVFISQPILDRYGRYLGYVGGSIYLQQQNVLHRLLGEHFYQDSSYLYVVDRDRRLIYHKDPLRIGDTVVGNPAVERVIAGEMGTLQLTNSDGIEMLAGFAPVPTAGWGIVAQRPLAVTEQELNRLMLDNLRQALPLLLLSLIGIWWLSQRISRPLWQLARSAQQWGTDESLEQVRNIKTWYFEANQLKRAVLSSLALMHQRLDRLSQESLTDPLTGLRNRRGMHQQLDSWREHRQPFAAVALDIDHFKRVNDQYGHEFGDRVLQNLARLMANGSRPSDLLCRTGGEEFLMLLPDADLETARQVAERVRRSMAETHHGECSTITLSAGVAHWPETAEHVEEVLKRADEALYQAKNEGRNRVVVSEAAYA